MRWGSVPIDDNPQTTFALTGVVSTAGGPIEFGCLADDGADGIELSHGRIAAIKTG
jgi:hypothetical protein